MSIDDRPGQAPVNPGAGGPLPRRRPPGEPSSQAVQVLPPVPSPTLAAPMSTGRRPGPLLGLPLPAWIIAAALAIVLVIGLVVILPRLGRDRAPGGALPDGGVGVVGTGGAQPSGATAPNPSGGAPTRPDAVPSGATVVPPGTPALRVELAVRQVGLLEALDLGVILDGLLGWRVAVTIHNPAGVEQAWTSVSVHAQGGLRLAGVSLTDGVEVSDGDTVVCAKPQAPATVAAGGSVTVEFVVRSTTEPHTAAVNDAACDPQ